MFSRIIKWWMDGWSQQYESPICYTCATETHDSAAFSRLFNKVRGMRVCPRCKKGYYIEFTPKEKS